MATARPPVAAGAWRKSAAEGISFALRGLGGEHPWRVMLPRAPPEGWSLLPLLPPLLPLLPPLLPQPPPGGAPAL